MAIVQQTSRQLPTFGLLPRRSVWAAVALLVFIAAWQGYGWMTAPSRIAPALQEALARGDQPLYDIAVELPFPPRQFHIKLFQSYGTFAGTQGTTVLIRRVPPANIQEIARKYWVRKIDLAQLQ